MKRRYTVLFALVASFLVVSAVPVAVADTSSLAVGSSHTTATDFNSATTLDNVAVEGSGTSASVALQTSATVDDFNDGDMAEWGGSTGSPGVQTQTGTVWEGSHAAQASTDDSDVESLVAMPGEGLSNLPDAGDKSTLYVRSEEASSDSDEAWFYYGVQSDGGGTNNHPSSGYRVIMDFGDNEITLSELGGDGTLGSTSASISPDTWYKVEIDWQTDGDHIITVSTTGGSQVAQISASGGTKYTDGGIALGVNDRTSSGATAYYDNWFTGSDSATGSYVSADHDVGNAKQVWADVTLTNADATIEAQAYDGSSWITVNSTTVSSTGNYTLGVSGTGYDRWRVRVDFSQTADSATAELHDEGVQFDPRAPSADGATASPKGGTETNNEDVTLSVPVSDSDFGTSQGDSVTVDFYVDGAQVDSATITSNGTVSTTATGLADGDHTWHVELADSYGETSSSSTWNFTVNHYAAAVDDASASPQGGQQFNDENIETSVNISDRDFAEPSGDSVTVDFYVDGTQVDSATITSNGTVTFNATDLGDGAHTWHVETTDEYGLNSSSSTFNFEVNHYAPAPDNGNATPSDGAQKTTRMVTFSVPVNDTDFAETSGDEVQATFYLDGEQFATKNITANGTVSASTTVSTGGTHDWHVELVDEYGNTNETDADPATSGNQAFTFYAPSELKIYNESAPNQLVDEVTVNIQFYGGQDGDAFTVQRSTSNGVINMSGLPADQEFIVVVNSEGYHNRRIYVESLYEQANVFLLPESANAVYNVFKIDDKSGAYPPGETRLIIQRALNRSGNFTWQTVSGDFFGSTNEHKTYLRFNVRYRLIVENDQGDRRMMGPYFATDENNPKVITVSSIVVKPPDGQSYYGTSYITDETEDDGQKTLRFTYTDPEDLTDSLDVVIHERGNESNVLADVSTDNVGTEWTYSTVLDENESAKSWVVDWQGQRDGEEIGAMVPVGNRGGLPLPMSGEWLTRFGLIALVVVASLSSERMATIGAMGTVAFAGILMITGIWEIPVVLWFAALIIAVGGHALTKAQRGGVVG